MKPLRRAIGLLLLVALAIGPTVAVAVAADKTAREAHLQHEMERLFAQRTVDPVAFVAQTRTLEAQPAPTTLAQREFLRFLRANRLTLEGRIAEALAEAMPLAEAAESPALRLRAGALVVSLHGFAREAEAGLRRLNDLLEAHPEAAPGLEAEQLALWATAATFHLELGQYARVVAFADRVLAADPAPREACFAASHRIMALQALGETALEEAGFTAVGDACRAIGERVMRDVTTLAHVRFLRAQGRLDDALALLLGRLGEIESTRFPRVVAEAYALDAELLFAAGRIDAAQRQAEHAVALARGGPTSLPMAMAEKVLHEIALQRGDDASALRHLQRHVAASRVLAEEARLKELAFQTVQHETLHRRHALALLDERHRVLALEAEAAKAESRTLALALGALVLSMLVIAGWGWRLRRAERRFRVRLQTDALTGFANRAHFNRRAEALLARAKADGAMAMLCTFDLDRFKRINDQHGHLAGDAVLRAVSAAVRAVPPPEGVRRLIGRIGGEEFALLLAPATLAQAMAHAEACRVAVAQAHATIEGGTRLAVTASFGISGTPDAGYRLDTLLAESDRALYRAKSDGRDRVSLPTTPAPLQTA